MGEEQKQEEQVIIKPVKNPGRVAQGHKLAALMKKRKEDLKQQKGTVESTVKTSSGVSSVQSGYIYGAGGFAVLLALVVGFYIFRKKPARQPDEICEPSPSGSAGVHAPDSSKQKKKQTRQPDIDIFKMS